MNTEKEIQERIHFKMEELLTAVENTSKHLWNFAANTGHPKYEEKRQAFNHFAKMLRKEMNMSPPYDNMAEKRFMEYRNKAVDDIAERLKIRGERDSHHKESFLVSVIEKAMRWCL